MDYIIPIIICSILVYGLIKKVDIIKVFCDGAMDGVKTVYNIFPMLLLMLTAVYMLRASTATDFLSQLVAPLFHILGIPPETAPLVLLKPLSGSGGLAIGTEIITGFGADSMIGRTAAVMLAASETSIYTISVYFAYMKITKTRHALPAALTADITAFIAAAFFTKVFFL